MKSIALAFFLVISCLEVGLGQTTDLFSTLRTAQDRNWYLRVSSQGNVLAEGRVRSIGPDSVSVGSSRLLIPEISEVERRTREGGAAITGAVVGALAVGGLFYSFAAGFCEYRCGRNNALAFGSGAALGGLLGGLIGEAAHPADHVWSPIWQRVPNGVKPY